MQIFIFISIVILLAIEIALFLFIRRTADKIDKALGKSKGKSIMKMLAHIVERYETIEKDIAWLLKENEIDKKAMQGMVQKINIVRFNPFKEMGGKQSFCITILDGQNSGAIITNLYNNDGSRMYIKNIKNGESKQNLSEEEEKSLNEAKK